MNIGQKEIWSGATSRRISPIFTAKWEGRRGSELLLNFAFKCLKNLITFITLTYKIILYQEKDNI